MKKYLALLIGVLLSVTPIMAFAEDCVELDLELTPAVGPDTCGVRWVEFSVEVTNCGTERGMVDFSVKLDVQPPFGVAAFKTHRPVGAGQTVLFSHKFPVPRVVPAGTYEACLTATIGTASATDCASVILGEPQICPACNCTCTSTCTCVCSCPSTCTCTCPSCKCSGGTASVTLGQNYPNPFNLETGIKLGLVKTSDVSLKIYNILGEEVRTLADGRYGPGDYALTWDARDGNGTIVPSGVYFYRLTADDQVATRKMSLLK